MLSDVDGDGVINSWSLAAFLLSGHGCDVHGDSVTDSRILAAFYLSGHRPRRCWRHGLLHLSMFVLKCEENDINEYVFGSLNNVCVYKIEANFPL